MPTGYTEGIINGTTKSFEDFAKQCMRAFGATIHMRDDCFDTEYTPRVPSDYHIAALKKAKEARKELKKMSDKDLIAHRRKELKEDRKRYFKYVTTADNIKQKLEVYLTRAKNYMPPAKEFLKIKEFMIDQLVETIKHDGNSTYYKDKIEKIDFELKTLDPIIIAIHYFEEINWQIKYHTKEHKAELKRCEESNKWVEDFIKSLEYFK